jgi:hypothetical protein
MLEYSCLSRFFVTDFCVLSISSDDSFPLPCAVIARSPARTQAAERRGNPVTRYNKKDCFAGLSMTEAELIEKLRISFPLGKPQYVRDNLIPAFSARVLASKRIN